MQSVVDAVAPAFAAMDSVVAPLYGPFVRQVTGVSHEPYVWNKPEDPTSPTGWYNAHQDWLLYAAVAYLPTIFLLRKWMANREPLGLKIPLALWNLALAIFSFCGLIAMVPTAFSHVFQKHGGQMAQSVCDRSIFDHESTVWVHFFCLSKIPEFVDTIFICLRKKPLIFLHWYHHIATMLYCWYAHQYSEQLSSASFWFSLMNLFVHSAMYSYYFLAACGHRPKWNMLLTVLQITQMVGGVWIILSEMSCPNVEVDQVAHYGGLAMYLSYFILFVNMFVHKYMSKSTKKANKKKTS